jgi:hypothetical protein
VADTVVIIVPEAVVREVREDQAAVAAPVREEMVLDQGLNLNIQNTVQLVTGFQAELVILHHGVGVAAAELEDVVLMRLAAKLAAKAVGVE